MNNIPALKKRIKDLEAMLGQNDLKLASTFQLSARLSDLLGLLMSIPVATESMVQDRLGFADARVAIHRLRKRLLAFHYSVGLEPEEEIIETRYGLGWAIDDDMKQKLRDLL